MIYWDFATYLYGENLHLHSENLGYLPFSPGSDTYACTNIQLIKKLNENRCAHTYLHVSA